MRAQLGGETPFDANCVLAFDVDRAEVLVAFSVPLSALRLNQPAAVWLATLLLVEARKIGPLSPSVLKESCDADCP
jgi:hypothetical protein